MPMILGAPVAPGPTPKTAVGALADTDPRFARYALLAWALAGERVAVRAGGAGPTFTDGQAIYLTDADQTTQLIGLVVQSALLGAGSLHPDIVFRLRGRRRAARRFLTLEAARALERLGASAPRTAVTAVSGHWPGANPASAGESLERALGREPIPEAPESFGTVHPVTRTDPPPSVPSAATPPEDHGPELEDDAAEESVLFRLFASPSTEDHALSRWLRRLFRMGRGPEAEVQGGTELPVDRTIASDGSGSSSRPVLVSASPPARPPAGEAFEWEYPEWDGHRGIYLPGWCRVAELDVPVRDDEQLQRSGDHSLARRLARVGLAYERHGRQTDGEDLDVGTLLDFAVARARGEAGDDRVYQTRRRTARNLGVMVLLDASGSTAERRSGGQTVWEEHRELAFRLTSAFEALGDRVGVYGFNSQGRRFVQFLRVKRFADRFDQAARNRLASISPSGFTRIGSAVRHGTHMVTTQAGTAHRLVLVVSDGFPYDDDYRSGYGEQDTRRALAEAGVCGVGCVCVSMASSTSEAVLERAWGSATHIRLADAAELDRHVEDMVHFALRAAAP